MEASSAGARRLRPFGVFARWRTLAASRELARESVGTLQGRLMLAMCLVALPGLLTLQRTGGPLVEAGLDDLSKVGALFLGQMGLALCLLAMIPVLTAKVLVHTHDLDPLAAHGGFRPELAVFRVGAAVAGVSGFLSLFFTLFHGSLLAPPEGGRILRAALFATVALQLLPLGVVAAEGTRRTLAGPGSGTRADVLRAVGAIPFLVSFPAFVWIPVLVHRHTTDGLAVVGRGARGGLDLLGPGGALLGASAEGRATLVLTWSLVLAAGLLGSGWALARWLELGSEALGLPDGRRLPARPFGKLPLAPRWGRRRSLIALFLWKDVFLEHAQRPLAYLGFHAVLLAGTCLLAKDLPAEATMLAASAGVSLPALGALGKEGRVRALLRPACEPERFFALKWAVGWVQASAHLPLQVLALTLVSGVGSDAAAAGRLVVVGGAGALAFTGFGTSLGFLLPDTARRSFFLPGASRAGQALFSVATMSFIAGLAWIPDRTILQLLAMGLAFLAVGLGVSVWGIRRFARGCE